MSDSPLLYFTASWCAPCKALLPKVQKVADQHGIRVEVVSLDADPDRAMRHHVTSVPTMILPSGLQLQPARLPWPRTRDAIAAEAVSS